MAVATSTTRKWANVPTVALVVGVTKTIFHVHEVNLFEASPFFKAAFTSDFRETSERTMTLPEDDEVIFELFVNWLYFQSYDIPSQDYEGPNEDYEGPNEDYEWLDEDYDRFMQPVQLFVLADKYNVRNLKSLIISRIFLAIKQELDWPSEDTIAYAYEHTSHNSTIRKLFADILACHFDPDWYQKATTQNWLLQHPEISADVNVSFATQTLKRKNPFSGKMPEGYVEKTTENEEECVT